jgi:uncharacterized phage protein (TIGR01671 family)
MRDIRFRAWDKKEKAMSYSDEVEFSASPDCDFQLTQLDGFFGWLTPDEDNRYVLMQFTGLEDKNGKEIYEGDIISFSSQFGKSIWEVFWFSGTFDINGSEYSGIATGFWVRAIKPHKYGRVGNIEGLAEKYQFTNYGGNGGVETKDCKVIGNIYENPELLKKEARK